MDLVNYGLRERYEQLKKRGDRLDDIKKIIDWESLRPLLKDLFTNDTEQGGKAFQSIVSFTNFSESLMKYCLYFSLIYLSKRFAMLYHGQCMNKDY